jgi:hypothetical protein
MDMKKSAIVDLNNDSFLDIVTTYTYGASIAYNNTFTGVFHLLDNRNEEIIIYPTPAINYFNIKIKQSFDSGRLQIFTTEGKIILNQDIKTENVLINSQQLPIGMYLIRFICENKIYSGKLIIE